MRKGRRERYTTHCAAGRVLLKIACAVGLAVSMTSGAFASLDDPSDYSEFSTGYQYGSAYPDQSSTANFPVLSWDKVPRWLAARNTDPFSDAEVSSMAQNYQLVMLEKANNQGLTYVEDGVVEASKRLKAVNPTITTLFYWNSWINYFGYEANNTYNANWSDKDENGDIVLFKDLYYTYDYQWAGLRTWWINAATETVASSYVDGVFVDKVHGATDGVDDSKYVRMLTDLYAALPSNKICIGNALRNERWGGNRQRMNYMDGSYFERWHMFNRDVDPNQSELEAVHVHIQLMREAGLKGKIINMQTGPADSPNYDRPTVETEANLKAYYEETVTYPLAVFLIAAEGYAYFSFQDTVAAADDDYKWDTSYLSVFSKPLGNPLGAPTRNGNVYERSYEYCDVYVNVNTHTATLTWYDEPQTTTQFVQIRKCNALDYCLNGGSGGADGQNVNLWTYIDGHKNLTWEEIDRGNGYYSYQKKGTTYSLDGGNGGANSQTVYLWTTSANNQNQQWKKVDMGGGFYQLQKRNALGFALNGGSGGANGQDVNLWSSDSTSRNLQWEIEYK